MPTSRVAVSIAAWLGSALISTAAYGAQPVSGMAVEKQFSQWIGQIEHGLKSINRGGKDEWQPFDWRHEAGFVVMLDGTGNPANPYFIPGGVALPQAAVAYALTSGDFNVTLGELEQSGWWPYSFAADIDRTLVVQPSGGWRHMNKYTDLKHLGSPGWVLGAKSEILRTYYEDFFFRLGEDTRRSGMISMEDLKARIVAEQKPKRAVADLSPRLPHFWTNPVSGLPMTISDQPGDMVLRDISWAWQNAPRVSPDGRVNAHAGGGYYGSGIEIPKPEKLEVVDVRGYTESAAAWSERVGNQLPVVPDWLAHGRTSPEATAHLEALLNIYKPLEEQSGRTNELELDTTGERAPIEQLACPIALSLAASYYALATLDNQVSLRDIIELGFWPYDTFPTWLDLSETLYDFPRSEAPKMYYSSKASNQWDRTGWQWYLADNIGTPEWLLWRRAEILNQVHAELFFAPHPDYAPAQGFDPAAASALPKFDAFWVNPLASAAAGKPVAFTYGPMLGQLSTLDVNLLRPIYGSAPIRYAQTVPLINLADKTQLAAGAGPEYRYRQRTLMGVTEGNRAWHLDTAEGSEVVEVRWKFGEPMQVQESVLLDVGWDPEPQQRLPLAMDGTANNQPHPIESRRPYTQSYKLGAPVDNFFFSGEHFHTRSAQIIFDSVAPLIKRYNLDWKQQPRDYRMVLSLITGPLGMNQVPGGRAGIDELAPSETTEVAMK